MATLINGTTCYDAWYNASNHIINQPTGDETNMIITISDPCNFTDLPLWIANHNPKNFHQQGDNIRHVINTIFPYKLRAYFPNRQDFYTKYSAVYSVSNNKKWGTYFQRLISFGKGINTTHPNQLENAINSLNGNSPQRFFINFHLTASSVESNVRPLGGPCWQFGELIKNRTGGIDFIVVYRNHDYFNKALGNFIGLSKLLEFICTESGQTPGNLIVHSIHAYSDKGINLLRQSI